MREDNDNGVMQDTPSAWDFGIAYLQSLGTGSNAAVDAGRRTGSADPAPVVAKKLPAAAPPTDAPPATGQATVAGQKITVKSDWLLRFSLRYRSLVSAPSGARMKVAHAAFERMPGVPPEEAAETCACERSGSHGAGRV